MTNAPIDSPTVTRRKSGAMAKYMTRAVGSDRIGALIKYELVTSIFGGIPGALGLVLRQKIYPSILGRCGRGVAISRAVSLRCPRRLAIGEGTVIDERVLFDIKSAEASVEIGARSQIMAGAVFDTGYQGRIEIGPDSLIGSYSILSGHGGLTIGANALIAGHCHLIAANHGHADVDRPMNRQGLTSKGIVIEDDVWLGSGVRVLDGVRIGRGSIVSAGAVVTRDVEPYSIMAGVPANLIRYRTDKAEPAGSD